MDTKSTYDFSTKPIVSCILLSRQKWAIPTSSVACQTKLVAIKTSTPKFGPKFKRPELRNKLSKVFIILLNKYKPLNYSETQWYSRAIGTTDQVQYNFYFFLVNQITFPNIHSYWHISNWLLKPARPIDLTNFWAHSVISDTTQKLQPLTTPIQRETNDTKTLQTVLYFCFPSLPVLTILVALINVVYEAKNYTCPRKLFSARPYVTRLSHRLMVFFVLTCITACLTWLAVLTRYIPMTHVPTQLSPVSNRGEGKTHSDLNSPITYDEAPNFVSHLPAILTMQAVLRLTLLWLVIGMIIDRIQTINKLNRSPTNKRLKFYLKLVHSLAEENCGNGLTNEKVDAKTEGKSASDNEDNDDGTIQRMSKETCQPGRNCRKSFHRIVSVCAYKICGIRDPELDCCYNCRRNFRHWYRKQRYMAWQHKHEKDVSDTNTSSVQNPRPNCHCVLNPTTDTLRSVGKTFIETAFVICSSLAICLPQLWAYEFRREQVMKPSFERTRLQVVEALTWHLTNRVGRAVYEYTLSTLSFVIPGFVLITILSFLVIRMHVVNTRLQKRLSNSLHLICPNTSHLHEFAVQYCVKSLNRDSLLIFLFGLLYIVCWLPQSLVDTIHRLSCLLGTSEPGADGFTWITKKGLLLIQLLSLFGEFFIQIVFLVLRACEPSWIVSSSSSSSTAGGSCSSQSIHNDEQVEGSGEHENEAENRRNRRANAVPSEDGKTSQNISPLPTSHTMSERVRPMCAIAHYPMSPKHGRSCQSNPSPFGSPYFPRTALDMMQIEPHSMYGYPPKSSFNEPRSMTVMLTYSPRSRHPLRMKPDSLLCPLPPNTPASKCKQWPVQKSPPPLPPPPRHLNGMIGDSSIYSTPDGSPTPMTYRCIEPCTVHYSPDLGAHTFIQPPSSPGALSFRQTDSGITGLGGSVSMNSDAHYDTQQQGKADELLFSGPSAQLVGQL
ncbi:unnamed protein product [Calicophoron daubneyi]|uniref:Uncharacterized protein n=1 Tax=Calicophoron daubneyi TaxID=300641 RepID=A0AAV2U0E7_CALDB